MFAICRKFRRTSTLLCGGEKDLDAAVQFSGEMMRLSVVVVICVCWWWFCGECGGGGCGDEFADVVINLWMWWMFFVVNVVVIEAL